MRPTASLPSDTTTTLKKSETVESESYKFGSSERSKLQIFLGGSCNPTTWRQNVAIPFLETNGISYYNPQVEDWTPEAVAVERHAKQAAEILLFVIDRQTRSTVSLVESAFLAGDDRNLVLVVYPFNYDVFSVSDATTQTSNIYETKTTTSHSQTKSSASSTSASFVKSSSSTSSSTVTSRSSHRSIANREPTSNPSTSSLTSSTTTTLSSAHTTSKITKDNCEIGHRHLEAMHEKSLEASGSLSINGEPISLFEFYELKRARFILQNLVAKQRIPMFTDILQALDHVSKNLDNISEPKSCDQTPGVATIDRSLADEAGQLSLLTSKDGQAQEISHFEKSQQIGRDDTTRDIYLSLDCDDRTCLESTVIPTLKENGLTYYCNSVSDPSDYKAFNINAKSDNVTETGNVLNGSQQAGHQPESSLSSTTSNETKKTLLDILPVPKSAGSVSLIDQAVEREIRAIKGSRVLLFVITNKCRGLSIMVLASHFMALFRGSVVLCIQHLEEPCSINGEILTKTAIADYNRGRMYLCDYAIKSKVPVFNTIREAIECCSRKCRYKNNKK